MMPIKILKLFYWAYQKWIRCRSSRMAAAMTYFTMISLAPMLTFAIAIAGCFFDTEAARNELVTQVELITSSTVADTVSGLLVNAANPQSGIIAGAISILFLLYGASGVFSQLYDTFEEIAETPVEKRIGIGFLIRKRLLGIGMVLAAGLLILGSLIATSVVHWVGEAASEYVPGVLYWFSLSEHLITWLGLPLILFLMFWLIPSRRVSWSDVVPAAFLTSVLIGANRYLILAYLKFSSTSEVYGAAGSLVVLLIWIYMSAQVVFFGFAFARSWARVFGSLKDEAESVAEV